MLLKAHVSVSDWGQAHRETNIILYIDVIINIVREDLFDALASA